MVMVTVTNQIHNINLQEGVDLQQNQPQKKKIQGNPNMALLRDIVYCLN